MSSKMVRDNFLAELGSGFPTEKIIDLTAEYRELNDFLSDNGLSRSVPWVGVDFVGGIEEPITVDASSLKGKFRETGSIFVHVVEGAKLGASNSILIRADNIKNYLRAKRIGAIIIKDMTPPNFSKGATLDFEGGLISASVVVSYQCDFDL